MRFDIRLTWAAALLATALGAGAQTEVRKGYIVQLADPPAASYDGSVSGLPATRPATGSKLDVRATHVQNYLRYLDGRASTVLASVPAARVYHRYGVAINGFAAALTDKELVALASNPNVRAITEDTPRKMDTATTPTFLGLTAPGGVWSRLDAQGRPIKGEDVIIAHVDGGVWPENKSFADHVDTQGRPVFAGTPGATLAYQPLPAGRYLGTCQAGMGFTAANCNNKLIGAQYFNAGWKQFASGTWAFEYLDSPRDPDGHGTHTLSTSGGNANAMTPQGVPISGIAPRARVAAYRVCYSGTGGPDAATGNGCYTSDSVAAINKAVADKVDVINYSISGSQTNPRDAVGEAFKNAAAAGVFVSASAGNSGPGNAVAHLGTWLTTVGNSTHDRYFVATASLGTGNYTGAARFQGNGPVSAPVILAQEAALPGADVSLANLCYGAADNGGVAVLDPAKISGKIVVCDRGVIARVNKSLAVFQAGGVGMIMLNTSPSSLNNDEHSVPTVHLQSDSRAAVRAFAAGGTGSGSISASSQATGVIAPVMADSSSRGPNKGDPNVLKPDITAPGSDIFAAYANRANANPTDRNAILAGTKAGDEAAISISGTSMAAPHVAGVAALLKQANPTWSPYAIKSAIMSSAQQTVKLANGAPDPDRWGYGAGHLNPNGALDTKLVYDSTNADHQAYFAGSKPGADVNLASITRGDVIGTATVTRTVTNKGAAAVTYTAAASLPGYAITVTPSSFTLAPGASQTFTVAMTPTTAAPETWSFGELVWNGSDGSATRSPVSAKSVGIIVSSEITDTRASGSKAYTVGLGYTGRVVSTATGLVQATRLSASVSENPSALRCFGSSTHFDVPANSKLLRVQMFNSETEGGAATDFDLYVQRNSLPNGTGTWSTVGNSLNDGSDELVQLRYPQSGRYRLCFVAYATGGTAKAFTINRWLVGPTVSPVTLRALGAGNVTAGGVAALAVAWQSDAAVRSAGFVEYSAGAGQPVIGNSVVFIDPVSPPAAAGAGSSAIVYRDKKPLQD
jgi:subtilisin family serine protease